MSSRSNVHQPFRRVTGLLAVSAIVGASISGCGAGDGSGSAQTPAPQPTQTGVATPTVQASPSDVSDTAASPSTSASASAPSPSNTPSPRGGSQQTAVALQAIATARSTVAGGQVFDLEDETERGQRVWSAKVATPDNRQFNLAISQDGNSVVANDEDTTPDDDIRKLRSAKVALADAIDIAAGRAAGKGNLTSLEIDTAGGSTVVWQIEFGGDDGITVLVDATTGKVLDVGPDVG